MGAKAVVLVPLKQKECSEILDGMVLASPLIVMGTIFPGDWGMTGISQDCQEAGKMLGEAIAAGKYSGQAGVPIFGGAGVWL